jgi:hypothetical protein
MAFITMQIQAQSRLRTAGTHTISECGGIQLETPTYLRKPFKIPGTKLLFVGLLFTKEAVLKTCRERKSFIATGFMGFIQGGGKQMVNQEDKWDYQGGFIGHISRMRKVKPPRLFSTMDEMLNGEKEVKEPEYECVDDQ